MMGALRYPLIIKHNDSDVGGPSLYHHEIRVIATQTGTAPHCEFLRSPEGTSEDYRYGCIQIR